MLDPYKGLSNRIVMDRIFIIPPERKLPVFDPEVYVSNQPFYVRYLNKRKWKK